MWHTRCKPLLVGDARLPLSTDSLRWAGNNLNVKGRTSWPVFIGKKKRTEYFQENSFYHEN